MRTPAGLFYGNSRLLLLAIALISVSGFSAFQVLPRAEDPTLINRTAKIVTRVPGATAERIEATVTEPIEDALSEIEEIWHLDSTSRGGVSVIVVELEESIDLVDEVWSRVRDKINDVEPFLPPTAQTPEFDEATITAFTMLTALRWDGTTAPNYTLLRRLSETLEDRLRNVEGTADVELFGEPREEVRVEVETDRLIGVGLTPRDVARAIRSADAKVSSGEFLGDAQMLIEMSGELTSVARVGRVPVRVSDAGRVLRVTDLAEVRKTVREPIDELSIIDGQPAIIVAARMQDGFRVDWWAAAAREIQQEFEATLPKGVTLRTVFDQSAYVETRLDDLYSNLMIGVGLVVLVTLFIMGWRSAMVVGATLPLATLMTLAGMRFLGLPIHQMSVTGLIIALGLLIDNAIVMADAVSHARQSGQDALQAVDSSVRRLCIPLVSSTLTTVLAFMPIVLAPGGAGEFIGPLGSSVIIALVSSFILAMTIVPAVSSLLDRRLEISDGWFAHGLNPAWLNQAYRSAVGVIVRSPAIGICVGLLLPALGFAWAGGLEMQFFPPAERDQFHIEIRLPAQASLERTRQVIADSRPIFDNEPEVRGVHWFIGNSAPKFYYNLIEGQDDSQFYAQALVETDGVANAEMINRIQAAFDRRFSNAQVLCRQLEQGPPFNAPIELRLFGPDLERLRELGLEMRQLLATLPEVTHTRSTMEDGTPKLVFNLDEEAAGRADLDNSRVAQALEDHLRGVTGGTILEGTEEIPVRVRVANKERAGLESIESINLLTRRTSTVRDGRSRPFSVVPISTLGSMTLQPVRSAIARRDHQRVNTVQAFLQAGVLPATILGKFENVMADSGFVMPAGYGLSYGGEADRRQDAVGRLMASVGVLATLMVATLVLSFGSFRLAGVIVMVGVLAVGLALLAIESFGFPFGFIAIVATMGLVGVAINDTIVVLTSIHQDSGAREGDVGRVADIVVHETRHVLATTLTTMAGFSPLLLGGGEFWPPLAVAIGGGVIGATLLALVFVPAVYVLLRTGRLWAASGRTVSGYASQQEVLVPTTH